MDSAFRDIDAMHSIASPARSKSAGVPWARTIVPGCSNVSRMALLALPVLLAACAGSTASNPTYPRPEVDGGEGYYDNRWPGKQQAE